MGETFGADRPKRSRGIRICLALLAMALAGLGAARVITGRWWPFGSGPAGEQRTFDGASTDLRHTQVVPTLDTLIEPGKNVVWCGSFLLAWKQIQNGITREPVLVKDTEDVCKRLNKAADPAPNMPAETTYAAAGFVDQGILDTIRRQMARRFPRAPAPTFGNILPNGFVAYAYLEARATFRTPYVDNKAPFWFVDAAGKKTRLRSFGMNPIDARSHPELPRQIGLLYEKPGGKSDRPTMRVDEFALDLCIDSEPHQIVVACIPPKETLAATYADLQERIRRFDPDSLRGDKEGRGLSDDQAVVQLQVPEMFWRLRHDFSELAGKTTANPALRGQRMDVAFQLIQFRLDRSGAELASETKIYPSSQPPKQYHVDRPFLLYMKKRDAADPFFVMWVANAELLRAWDE